MPELPEVETIREDLSTTVVGARVEGAKVLYPSLVERAAVEDFESRLEGVEISGASRRGKNLILEFDSGDSLVLQLKIGGQLLLVPPVEEPDSALMLVLSLEDERRVFLRDETSYTRARILHKREIEEEFSTLGPDPLDARFTPDHLRETLGRRKAQIKPLLLDQKLVSGVGNIYVDESLYDARVHPKRKANSLSNGEWESLRDALVENISRGIEHRGTTFSLYRDLFGRKGSHQEHLRVFLRSGSECPRCGVKIVREKVGGRATFLCPGCQKENGPEDDIQLELL